MNNDNDDNSISNYNSWCDMIEHDTSYNVINNSMSLDINDQTCEISNSLKINVSINNFQQPTDQNLTIDDILELDYRQLTELCLLKHQSYVILQLKKHITICKSDNIIFDVKLHIEKIKWLSKTTQFLLEKRKLKTIKNKNVLNNKKIRRNSYDFCEKGNVCVYHKKMYCKKKHFVYNYLKCDIDELLNYVSNTENISTLEVYTSINTISYVINHMKDELYHVNK